MRTLLSLLLFLSVINSQAADKPTDKPVPKPPIEDAKAAPATIIPPPTVSDALEYRTAQLAIAEAQSSLDQLLKQQVYIAARANVMLAQQFLDALKAKHPGCELLSDNSWRCAPPASVPPATTEEKK